MLCSVSRASAGLTTEYLIVSSKPPTGYYVDGVTACPVSRASAGLTEYLIVSNLEPLALEIVCLSRLSALRCSGVTRSSMLSPARAMYAESVSISQYW